jgi:hypothetical protein
MNTDPRYRKVATPQKDTEANSTIDNALSAVRDTRTPHFAAMQIGIACIAASAFWWWGVYMWADDYNDYNPFVPSAPIFVWLGLCFIIYTYELFRAEKRVTTAASNYTSKGWQAMFTVDHCETALKMLVHLWLILEAYILISYMTYYHYDAHVLSPPVLWAAIGGLASALLISNMIRRWREINQ